MQKAGPNFYDDEAVFATYMRHRQRTDTPNDTLEKPVILDLVGSVANKRIPDLGCGDAAIGRDFLANGAVSYVGVEGSQRMAALARQTLVGVPGRVISETIDAFTFPSGDFDLVLARLSLHYVADLTPIFSKVFESLVPGGKFVFSVEHPVITSCGRGWTPGTARQDWVVDDYFSTGLRITNWLGGQVHKYHRTVQDYFGLAQAAGFRVTNLREADPHREHFQDAATSERRKRIPLFLILAAIKPI